MKSKLLCLVFMLALASAGHAQQSHYYWSGGKKITLTPDSSQLIIVTKNATEIEKVKSTLRSERVENVKEVEIGSGKSLHLKIAPSRFKELQAKMKSSTGLESIAPLFRNEKTEFYFTNEILVQPKKGVTIETLINRFAVGKITLKSSTAYSTFVLETKTIKEALQYANELYESGLVDWCHPNFTSPIVKMLTPVDPLYVNQYYLNNTGQLSGTSGIDINAPEAWDITRGCNNTRIVVVDEGVEAHEDMAGRVLAGNTPRTGGNGTPVGTAGGHGVSCSGIIAASHNTLGVSGIAPNAQIIPVNIFSGGETVQDIANGINWAWNPALGNADIISNSWGFNTTAMLSDAIIQSITNARTMGRVRNGAIRGCIVVFASGNFAQSFPGVSFPANVSGVITVGAINNQGAIWNYSSRGSQMDLVAPSGNVNLLGNVRTTDRTGANGFEPGEYTDRFGGTSAACPQIAGVAALILAINPNLTEAQVTTILQQTATDMGSNGFDNTFGHGRVNAQAALNRALTDSFISISASVPVVCTTATFTLQNQPAGTTLSWLSANPSGLTIDPITGSATRVNNFAGIVNITATIANNGNGCATSITKAVKVGNYLPTGTSSYGSNCSGGTFNTLNTSLSGACTANSSISFSYRIIDSNYSNFVFTPVSVPSGASWSFSGGTLNMTITAPPTQGSRSATVALSATGPCGPYNVTFTSTAVNYYSGPFFYSYSPNPTSETLTIEQTFNTAENSEVGTFLKEASSDTHYFKLYDFNNYKVVLEGKLSGKTEIDVSKLTKGRYVLKIQIANDKEETHHIIVN